MFICQFCNKEWQTKNAHIQHEIRCPSNANRLATTENRTKLTENQKLNWSQKCLAGANKSEWTEERRSKQSTLSKEINKKYWTVEKRKLHSELMKIKVLENPESYTKQNVSGRAKLYTVMSAHGLTKVKGTWELEVAEWLNNHNIKWTNNITPYKYWWNDEWHQYFPDFLLIETGDLIEVKGFKTARDSAKWAAVVDTRLIIIDKTNRKNLDDVLCYLKHENFLTTKKKSLDN